MLKEFSEECASLTADAARRLVYIGGNGIAGRTGILRGPRLVVSLARSASDGEEVEVIGPGAERRIAKVKAFDSNTGLVVLEADRSWEGIGEWTIAPQPSIGAFTLTVAYPSPDGPEAALSSLRFSGDRTRWGNREVGPFFQTTASAFPGFAGAAVIDAAGALVGVVAENEDGNGGWALGAVAWNSLVEDLLRDGSLRPYRLGLGLMPVVLAPAQAKLAGRGEAALVISVRPGSPAEAAGFLLGDIVLEADGRPISRDGRDLASLLSGKSASIACLSGEKRVDRVALPVRAED
jgi:S1-C subfamily serine protease